MSNPYPDYKRNVFTTPAAQPKQEQGQGEQIGVVYKAKDVCCAVIKYPSKVEDGQAVYTTPQHRKPLTDEQKQLKFVKWGLIPANQSWQIQDWFYAGIAYAEAAHGIKE